MGSLHAEDIDGNGLLDLIGVTAFSGVSRYELSNSGSARILWGTSRG